MILLLIGFPVTAGLVALAIPTEVARVLNAVVALACAAVALALLYFTWRDGVALTAAGETLRADGLGALVAVVVSLAAAVGACGGARSFTGAHPGAVRQYTTLAPLLAAALLVASLADHLGVLWISLELAAVMSAFLIGSAGGKGAQEAAFKYMILGSAGLVLALLATSVVHSAGVPTLGHGDEALSFHRLLEAGPQLAPRPMRIALALATAGYGFKVGLFPLHVWKPDAYAHAPAPVAALLAGAAVAVPLAALVRFGALASAAGEGAFAARLFVIAGAASMVAALFLMVREQDLRRILAFTSVEHLGLVLLSFGVGPAAMQGGLLHLVGNGALKALAFAVLGFAVAERGGGAANAGPGLYHRSFGLAAMLLVVVAAGLGLPPFSMFTSELFILRALFGGGHYALGVVVLASLAAIFGVVATATLRLVFARSEGAPEPPVRHGRAAVALGVPVLLGVAWLGMAMPPGLWAWLDGIGRGLFP